MLYKKIYIEITNICNLSCSFCAKNNRKPEFMSKENFIEILNKIKEYTNYIYLHVMGEPLLHPNINEFIEIASEKGFQVNLTTNGTLLSHLKKNSPIRQLNISLHALKEQNNKDWTNMLLNIFEKCEELAEEGTYINYRIWRKNCDDIIKQLENRYQVIISNKDKSKTLVPNIYYSKEEEFTWPIENQKEGKCPSISRCRAIKDHIAILVDGTIVPCCLDNNGNIPLGNIFSNHLEEIIHSTLYNQLLKGFRENKKLHKLCQNCTFYEQKKHDQLPS